MAILALALISLSAQGEKWLTKKGADPDDRVLGHVANDDPDDFITCSKQHVKISTVKGARLTDASIGCGASLDSADSEEQERQDAEKHRQIENDRRIIQKLTTSDDRDDSGEKPQP